MRAMLVCGATGLIGSSLVEYFSDCHAIDIVSTSPNKTAALSGKFRECFTWQDIVDDGEGILGRYDTIINMSGAPMNRKWTDDYRREIHDSRAGVTEILVDRMQKIGPSGPRLLNASATWIYGYHPDIKKQNEVVFEEGSAPDPYGCDNFVVGVCKSWEEALEGLDERRVVKLRIGVVVSMKGGVFPIIAKYTRIGLGGRVGRGLQPFTWVSLSDTLRAISFIVDREEIHGPVNIVAPENITQYEAAKIISRFYGRPSFLGLPALVVRALHGEVGTQMTLNGPQVAPRVLLSAGFRFEDAALRDTLEKLAPRGASDGGR